MSSSKAIILIGGPSKGKTALSLLTKSGATSSSLSSCRPTPWNSIVTRLGHSIAPASLRHNFARRYSLEGLQRLRASRSRSDLIDSLRVCPLPHQVPDSVLSRWMSRNPYSASEADPSSGTRSSPSHSNVFFLPLAPPPENSFRLTLCRSWCHRQPRRSERSVPHRILYDLRTTTTLRERTSRLTFSLSLLDPEEVINPFVKDAAKDFPNLSIKYLREYQSLGTAG